MTTKVEILDAALDALRRGETLTIDAVARSSGLTKPGVVYHFPTKEVLTLAVVNRLMDLWEEQLLKIVTDPDSALARFRAYIEFTLMSDFDSGELALFADSKLREKSREQWTERLAPWFGESIEASPAGRAALDAARLLADGAWLDRALGIVRLGEPERARVRDLALLLVGEGATK